MPCTSRRLRGLPVEVSFRGAQHIPSPWFWPSIGHMPFLTSPLHAVPALWVVAHVAKEAAPVVDMQRHKASTSVHDLLGWVVFRPLASFHPTF
jgi:hypothetical protein